MEENKLITEYKEKGLIDNKIIFFVGSVELLSGIGINVTEGSILNPFERINAIGLNGNTISAYKMKFNHLDSQIFNYNIDEIKDIVIEKKLFGKYIFKFTTDDRYYCYKITANKEKALEMENIIKRRKLEIDNL